MTDPILLLQQIAAQLQQEGKTPSLALFRARLAGRIAPQQLFSAYQQWRNLPPAQAVAAITDLPADATPIAADDKTSSAMTDAQLAATLTRIEAKLDLLLRKLGE